ncbi:UDP-N-acetylmuramoyl-L-alanine--D-glutamate ligase [Marinicella sp. W31]|uniref:UDP-N-acetylmuramoyl-L-alanine--D-glutamate ligase n=1 Tax=Marinicella sp. W31 TaxID=3023713 RepID=UPI003756CBB5
MHLEQLKLENLCGLNIAIWGYGAEGRAMAAYCLKNLHNTQCTVLCSPDEVNSTGDDFKGIDFNTQPITATLLDGFDVVIKSPGISPYQAPASETQTPLVSTAAIWFANHKTAPVIAITGTKGKSTVSSLLTHVLKTMGYQVILAGNIGEPLINCLAPCDYVVLETSSYQAQDGFIQADIGVLLNLFPEHLNWHGDESTYYQDKLRLIENSDLKLINAGDARISELLDGEKQALHFFNDVASYHEIQGVLMYRDKPLLSEHGWKLLGRHNLINAAAVLSVVEALQLDVRAAVNAMRSFKPLPHRLQTVTELNGVRYIDDSIASTPVATLAALTVVPIQQTVLLLGGYDRGIDWSGFAQAMQNEAPKMIICSGQNGAMIAELLRTHEITADVQLCDDLQVAVQLARKNTKIGDYVLLSPGAPSYDAFENYQARGLAFAQWINQS